MLQCFCGAALGCAWSHQHLETVQTTMNPHYQLSTKATLMNASWCCDMPAASCFPPKPPQELLQPATFNFCLSGINLHARRAALPWFLVFAESSGRCRRARPLSLVTPLAALQASHLLPHPAWQGALFKSRLQYTNYADTLIQ